MDPDAPSRMKTGQWWNWWSCLVVLILMLISSNTQFTTYHCLLAKTTNIKSNVKDLTPYMILSKCTKINFPVFLSFLKSTFLLLCHLCEFGYSIFASSHVTFPSWQLCALNINSQKMIWALPGTPGSVCQESGLRSMHGLWNVSSTVRWLHIAWAHRPNAGWGI